MTQGPVGIRCPDHASAGGKTAAPKRAARTASRSLSAYGPYVTFTLIGINVALFVLELATGGQLNGTGSWIYEKGVLVSTAVDSSGQVVGVAEGEWWRLITAAFLHYGLIHLGMNMLVLWFIGPPLEEYFGHGRYLLVYLVSGLAGSAGALIWSPNALTVGASGAIWGIMGAALVLEARRIWVFGGQAMGLVDLQPRDHVRHPRDLDRRPHRRARRRRAVRPRVLELPRLARARDALDGRGRGRERRHRGRPGRLSRLSRRSRRR